MSRTHCLCGRKLPPPTPGVSPREAEILQRIETIRESRMEAARETPPDLVTMRDLTQEERGLRAELTRLAHRPH
jgi:hypothetical protein